MKFEELFPQDFPVIGCVHLQPLPGSPDYGDNLDEVYEQAINEARTLSLHGVHGLIVENFGDSPFYPNRVSVETVASMSSVIRQIVDAVSIPVGVNVLRNDALAAMAIATATHAQFIRINIHMHAMLTDQGIIQGESYDTLRLKSKLGSAVQIWSDINVKHAQSIGAIDLSQWTADLTQRGKVDVLIVTGSGTGKEIDIDELETIKRNTHLPVVVGSGTAPHNIGSYKQMADGAIIGTFFKQDGITTNEVDPDRIQQLIDQL